MSHRGSGILGGESRPANDWVMSQMKSKILEGRNPLAVVRVIWLIHMWHDSYMWNMTHLHEICLIPTRHASFLCVTWQSRARDKTWSYVTWLMHMWHDSYICDMTDSYETWLIPVRHDFFMCTTWQSRAHDMPHSYVTWLIHVWHDAFICDMTHTCLTWLIHMWHDSVLCDMTYSCVNMTRSYLQ